MTRLKSHVLIPSLFLVGIVLMASFVALDSFWNGVVGSAFEGVANGGCNGTAAGHCSLDKDGMRCASSPAYQDCIDVDGKMHCSAIPQSYYLVQDSSCIGGVK